MGKVLRVFPRRNNAIPDDDLVWIGPPGFLIPDVDEVHVSCTFTWDLPDARMIFDAWAARHPNVKIGGPALGTIPGEFEPGMYLKQGFVITSRGCPNKCKNCFVPRTEGALRPLLIKDGWNIVDNNLLANDRDHVATVFDMLRCQNHPALFSGGLDVRYMDDWVIENLVDLRIQMFYIAYDYKGMEPLIERVVGKIKSKTGWSDGTMRANVGCYILVNFKGDTPDAALQRIKWIQGLGLFPYPMFYRGAEEYTYTVGSGEWREIKETSFGGGYRPINSSKTFMEMRVHS